MKYIAIMKVDVLQVLVNASASIGIGVLWAAFTIKAAEKVWSLANEPFYDYWSYSSDVCIEESPQIPKPMLPHYDSSESFQEITEPPPPYQLNSD